MRRCTHFSFVILFLSFVFSACSLRSRPSDEENVVSKIDAPEIVHAIQHYLPFLRHEKHLRLEDSRVYYDDSINAIRMEFISQDLLELREARMLLVDVVEGLLAELNKNPVLGPEFITYPLTPAQLQIFIDFESLYGLNCDPYYVGWMKLENNTSYFYAFDLKYPCLNAWNLRKESYDSSREFVVYERESEQLFQQAVKIDENTPSYLRKEQYRPKEKCRSRYFSPYSCQH